MAESNDIMRDEGEWLRVTLSSIGDAVITTDTNAAITFLNPIAEALTGWSLEEAVGVPLETVFKIVNEETRITVENPATQALRHGLVVGLANHTLLIAKDGSERAIDDSAAPILMQDGKIAGVVLVFRDVTERRKQEKALQESEERFRLMVEGVKDYAIFMLDPSGTIATWNAGAERIKGYTAGEIIGSHFSRFYTPEAVATGFPAHELKVAAETGRFEDLGWRVRKDGTQFWANVVITALRDETGELRGFAKVTRDLTERKIAEENRERHEQALRRSEERFRLMVESVKDHAIFMLDPQGNVATWNAGAERIKGYKADEIIGKHFSVFYPPETAASGFPEKELRVASGVQGRFEDEGWRIRKDGSRFWANVVITALHDEEGKLIGFSKVTRDLTERKAAEEALRSREKRFRTLTESANDGIISTDATGRIISWNSAAMHLFGYAGNEAIGQPLEVIMPERFRKDCRAGMERLRTTGKSQLIGRTIELIGLRNDGTEFPVEISLSAWRTEEGEFYTGIVRNIAERKQKEEALRQSQLLADINRRKDEFLAMLAHELRNPLAPISTAVELLRLEQDDNPVRQDAITILQRQVSTLTRLVDDLLEVSRISTGRIRLRQERIDLRAVAGRAADTVRAQVTQREQKLWQSLAAEPVWIDADATRIEQVVVNLLTNALKYTNPGGQIRLTVEPDGNEAVLSVVDTGVGISPELLPRVFELFTQADRSLDRSEGGLGIGLTIVQRLVDIHGGRVEARSAGLGHGSEFIVCLPLAQSAAAASEQPEAARSTNNVPGLRVLIVDDNKDAGHSTAMLLRQYGHEVRVIYSGVEAVETARDFRPNIVLLDIGLPEIDGYEVARRLRNAPEFGKLRIIAVTGYGQDTDQQRSQDAGFDAHLVKPVEPAKLRDVLAEFAKTVSRAH